MDAEKDGMSESNRETPEPQAHGAEMYYPLPADEKNSCVGCHFEDGHGSPDCPGDFKCASRFYSIWVPGLRGLSAWAIANQGEKK